MIRDNGAPLLIIKVRRESGDVRAHRFRHLLTQSTAVPGGTGSGFGKAGYQCRVSSRQPASFCNYAANRLAVVMPRN
ncbi:MAG: hypothetical protein KDB90_17915, partial [Planctomycetes bacterium]|nr:hypothetical protein [Planctomycetota bacterium]